MKKRKAKDNVDYTMDSAVDDSDARKAAVTRIRVSMKRAIPEHKLLQETTISIISSSFTNLSLKP